MEYRDPREHTRSDIISLENKFIVPVSEIEDALKRKKSLPLIGIEVYALNNFMIDINSLVKWKIDQKVKSAVLDFLRDMNSDSTGVMRYNKNQCTMHSLSRGENSKKLNMLKSIQSKLQDKGIQVIEVLSLKPRGDRKLRLNMIYCVHEGKIKLLYTNLDYHVMFDYLYSNTDDELEQIRVFTVK